jgi:hypothetical protein
MNRECSDSTDALGRKIRSVLTPRGMAGCDRCSTLSSYVEAVYVHAAGYEITAHLLDTAAFVAREGYWPVEGSGQ